MGSERHEAAVSRPGIENAPDEGGVGPEMLSPGGLICTSHYVDGLRCCQGRLTPEWEGSCDG